MRITNPGLYPGMSSAEYFSDPCESPSLTQSLAKLLLDRSPLHAWHAHPRLNPDWRADEDRKFDVGNIAHTLMLGRGKTIVVLDGFDDWRTKAAKEAREAAAAEGKLAVLGKHYALADRMVAAAREQLELRGLGHLFRDGDGEVVLAAQDGDAWLRQMVDWITPDRCTFVDFKTTDMSVAPHALSRKMATDGWPVQAAMAERILDIVDPDNAGRRQYLFVAQETEVPYALTVAELTEGPLSLGRKRLQIAIDVWRECIAENRWPGYPLDVQTPGLPTWTESEWLGREMEHHEAKPNGRDAANFGAG